MQDKIRLQKLAKYDHSFIATISLVGITNKLQNGVTSNGLNTHLINQAIKSFVRESDNNK